MIKGHYEIIELLKSFQSKVRCTLDHQVICKITNAIYSQLLSTFVNLFVCNLLYHDCHMMDFCDVMDLLLLMSHRSHRHTIRGAGFNLNNGIT